MHFRFENGYMYVNWKFRFFYTLLFLYKIKTKSKKKKEKLPNFKRLTSAVSKQAHLDFGFELKFNKTNGT